ncbi:MMPL family transporter [Streptomyces sp. NBC_01233]|uniref:MMPL family transporter n=1 Tax=Streptomyces sp. NBC_01233 TaxID=2903787 RepID=UPI002E145AA6|nr:MMPL family transporter [Streptomyces sp. NBC_01233]
MSRRAGVFVTRRPRLVLFAALVFLVVSAVFGAGATGRLKTQGYDDPRSESSRAAHLAAEGLGASPNLVVVAQARGGSVDDPAARSEGEALTSRLAARPHVSAVTSYWTGGAAELRGRDGDAAMVVAHVDGEGERLGARVKELKRELAAPASPGTALALHVGGTALVDAELQDLSESDLKRAEAVVLPGTLILLVLVFGSVVAAALPLLIGVLAIAGTLLVLSVLGSVTGVSVFALNLTTALGLGLGIDYGLLIVSRFREELADGYRPRNAAIRTVRTAGHTIVFSAATVSAALATRPRSPRTGAHASGGRPELVVAEAAEAQGAAPGVPSAAAPEMPAGPVPSTGPDLGPYTRPPPRPRPRTRAPLTTGAQAAYPDRPVPAHPRSRTSPSRNPGPVRGMHDKEDPS